MTVSTGVLVDQVEVAAYNIPTDEPESDGTFEWESTTIVVVEAAGGERTGLGYTYGPAAIGRLVDDELAPLVAGQELDPEATWKRMGRRLRNAGRPGMGFMAVAAVDLALWDLRARLEGVPLAELAGLEHASVPVYGSGGFTSYSLDRLREQLAGWVERGIPRVKMKVSRDPAADPGRLDAARAAIGGETELYVDANGALSRQQALHWAERFAFEWGVTWFEEPVSSADLEGLRLVRDRSPDGLDVAAGEYAYVPADFRNLLAAGAVSCLQADVTRCGGLTGLRRAIQLAREFGVDLSGHCAPAISAHAFASVPMLRHLEYFHDHVRVEGMLFDGVLEPEAGALQLDLDRPGNGLELKRRDAQRWQL
jgi:L-alanine-DL-glutamate epimerase-like enolase superfamily enzyme